MIISDNHFIKFNINLISQSYEKLLGVAPARKLIKRRKSSMHENLLVCIAFLNRSISKCACTNEKLTLKRKIALDAGHHFAVEKQNKMTFKV